MLDSDTRRRIDTARDILVGKVPDPKSQVEQITIALIYKFMDDMDVEAEELGGARTFFAAEFERYGWAKLMRSGLGGFETLNLYAEAITRMPENPGIPPLFRDIFKNAYLPYRDPETLKSFLKIIDEFSYDHSERLGDAFEYLLSVLGSQGDAGQFRTPRHIIDFIVEIVDPKKDETVLDPACGTAGFLISAYKHILRANSINMDAQDGQDEKGHSRSSCESCPSMLMSSLTPDERGRLAERFKGYDISPDMVRLSLVNMYLHGFVDPHVHEYDTLTSQERWNERADVILANPPFMSPKGGIRPHNRFSVQSKRSEVLFVDYMAEHLTPNGRAGIIVPEGVIFQSGTAYRQLRKMLVEEYLVAVVSLPAGVFNPYSGVKTSILILDKALARQSDGIAFFKVENDGFGLGAQRRPSDKNDLPDIEKGLRELIHMDRQDRQALISSCASCPSMLKQLLDSGRALIAPKAKIAASGDYNLSGERYRENGIRTTNYPLVAIGDICDLINGRAFKPADWETAASGGLPIVRIQNLNNADSKFNYYTGEVGERHIVNRDELLFSWSGSRGTSFGAYIWRGQKAVLNQHIFKVGFDATRATKGYLLHALNKAVTEVEENLHGGVGLVHITRGNLEKIQIPLPPLNVQREIVAEIEGYQRVIDGARAVVAAYRPHIAIDPAWPMVEISELAAGLKPGFACGRSGEETAGVPHIRPMNINDAGEFTWDGLKRIGEEDFEGREDYSLLPGDVLFNNTNSKELVGKTCVVTEAIRGGYSNHITRIRVAPLICDPRFLAVSLHEAWRRGEFLKRANKWIGQAGINSKALGEFAIPLPPLATQQAIVAEIEAEQALVNANRELMQRFERKIAAALARVWGEAAG